MYLARGVRFGAKGTWGVCNTPLPYQQKKLSLMIELWRLPPAIPAAYPLLRIKVNRTTECLSDAPDESSPPFQRPIYYTERESSKSRKVYPPHRMIANRLFEEYSEVVRGSIRSIEYTLRGVYDSAPGTHGAYAIRPYLTDRKSCS